MTITFVSGYVFLIARNTGVVQTMSPSFAICTTRIFLGTATLFFLFMKTTRTRAWRKRRIFRRRRIVFMNAAISLMREVLLRLSLPRVHTASETGVFLHRQDTRLPA